MKFLRPLDKALQKKFPQLYYRFIQKPRIQFRFSTEKQLLNRAALSQSEHPSILFFTTQKCASRYVGRILERLANAEGLINVDYDAYVTMAKVPKDQRPFSTQGALEWAFPHRGYLFGPLGSYRAIPEAHNFHSVLQLRDPRDVLTSLYFSTAFSHALINQKMVQRREAALQMGVDEYVLENAGQYRKIYSQYIEKLVGQPEVLFLKYEHMVSDFGDWLAQLSTHVQLAHHTETIQVILDEASFKVGKEDRYSQKRQVTPGDYTRKLKTGTIDQLNRILGDVLEALAYD